MSASPSNPFSVLMSVYKNDDPNHFYIAFSSILNQTLQPDEIVLVIDGPITNRLRSTIYSVSKKIPIVKVIELSKNMGLGAALDVGLSNCSHEIVARMDADDMAIKNRFETQINEIYNNKNISVLGAWVGEFESNHHKIRALKKVPLDSDSIFRYAKYRCPVNHPTVVFRKSHVEAVGGYGGRYLQEDYYLWVRLLLAGYLFKNVPDILVLMRAGSGLYKRRGGFKYALGEAQLFFAFYKIRFINLFELLVNLVLRLMARLMPSALRKFIYYAFLRSYK